MMDIQTDIERSKVLRMKKIGERLRRSRKGLGLSQIDIAEACAVTSAAVSNWELGTFLADDERLKKAAQRLKVDPEWLRTGKGKEPKHYKEAIGTPEDRRRQGRARRRDRYFDMSISEMRGGIGANLSSEVNAWWVVPQPLLQSLQAEAENLKAYPVLSDNFAPVITRGSVVFVDIAQKQPVHNAVFAINDGHSLVLKKIRIDAVNPSKIELSDQDGAVWITRAKLRHNRFKLLGRVIGQFSAL